MILSLLVTNERIVKRDCEGQTNIINGLSAVRDQVFVLLSQTVSRGKLSYAGQADKEEEVQAETQ